MIKNTLLKRYEYNLEEIKIGFKVKMGDLSDKEKENALNEIRILASIR